MVLNQVNLTFLAFRGELIGSVIHTDKGNFRVLELLDYDSMTHSFTLDVEDVDKGGTSKREFSDKYRYDVEQNSKREYPNDKRLKPKKR